MNILEILGLKESPKEALIQGDPIKPVIHDNYRIIQTEDGRFFPQVWGSLHGDEPSWLFLNEFSAKGGHPAWYTTYKYEVEPIELSRWCTDLPTAKRILDGAKKQFSTESTNVTCNKTYSSSKIINVIK